ncbi:hypothetical protein BBB50_15330 [Vibrio cholerae 2740-80]|uniref:hypothetical protein n=1 Tax=Vibrio cholerae TaxID=666 RepID=UPI0005973C7B|nr:hypothetical protein [Vibrio cholerae]EHK9054732.1 hypothetical protein [Vibrio vulnificus]HAS2380028.1 hypothetical protein [Vibrio cholerae O1]ANR89048.1 hypothetical protein BBB50_15330 [Vibrio cholerae 2740-80]EGQ9613284.1 hypothetical protein [Vibrio cholerae]EGR2428097.1 hypothetical protein [Vibrio cholerae]
MSSEQQLNLSRGIKKTDLLSGAAITGVATFFILTWSKTLPIDSTISPYITEQTISFMAGLVSYLITLVLSFIRYEISLILHERDYTKKIRYLDKIISITTCPEKKKEIEQKRNMLLREAANAIVEEKI